MKLKFIVSGLLVSFVTPLMAGVSDYTAVPPTIVESVDPNVMINMSIETPMGGAAYNDQQGTLAGGSVCGGRVDDDGTVGICYFATETYLGYFDPNKCYDYTGDTTTGYFTPVASAVNHTCNGHFSGNMLNWATMTAIDEFRWALTGGNRITDTTTTTIIKRARKQDSDEWFPVKLLEAGTSRNVAPSTVTPWNDAEIYIYNTTFQVQFGTTHTGSQKGTYNVRVKVCDSAQGLESNCQQYGSSYKPVGLMQKNADRMRFALMSYSADSSQSRNGGVLRANMKYIGPTRPSSATGGGTETNPNAEFSSTDGTFISNPDGVSLTAGVTNSGVINYINQFAESQSYKSHDPISELYYECVRYFKNLGRTPEYANGLTDAQKDGFPALTTWTDPMQHACQNNYIVGINDANPWLDKKLPGTHFTTAVVNGITLTASDYGPPSNPDASINVTTLTNTVGQLQGINGTTRCIGGSLTTFNNNATNKLIPGLGEVLGTCPYPPKQNSYYIAGLAYYANTQDLRSDFSGDQTVTTFMIDTQEYSSSPLTGQMNMLWLAGKYGGFEDSDNLDTNSDGNKKEPNLASEWDKDSDGSPDNYVLATNPEKLVAGLTKAFNDIKERVNSGTAAAVIANSASGAGALYQALYEPTIVKNSKQIVWGGKLHALFVDEQSKIREDSNSNAQLDSYSIDKVIELKFDSVDKKTKLYRYDTTDGNISGVTPTVLSLEDLKTIWSAREVLAGIDNTAIQNQRTFSNAANQGRYIFTWIDADNDGVVDNGEVKDFISSTFVSGSSDYFRYLGVSSSQATNLVDFIRGKEGIAGFRSRSIDYDNDNTEEVWRLGDIIHSTPVVVGTPSDNYDVKYNDSSYAAFRNQYANRRQVVYVGGNDGMLHAFNGGFWNSSLKAFQLKSGSDHPLGSELWAYVPMNLLPHLQWLTDINYPHVYYVDGPPQVFDVNIFTADAEHPKGWGTILVVGMRFGGGPIGIDRDGDGTNDKTLQSAYVILDITNPEIPPKLLAELSSAQLGFTTSKPMVVKARQAGSGNDWDNPAKNEWHLVFGSGPTALVTGTSNQQARLFAYKLGPGTPGLVTNFDPYTLTETNSFIGDIGAIDWDFNFTDDVAYFGTVVGTSPATAVGSLRRLQLATLLSNSTVSTLLDPGKPIMAVPVFSVDERGRRWINFGTGRLFVSQDNLTVSQQSFYGVKEPINSSGVLTWATVPLANLQDVTAIQVFDDGSILPANLQIPSGTDIDTFSQLVNAIDLYKEGWVRNFTYTGTSPSQRSITNAVRIRSLLLYTGYMPSTDVCSPEGTSALFALHYKTGTATSFAPIGVDTSTHNPSDTDATGTTENLAKAALDIGQGLASAPVLHRGSASAPNTVTAMIQLSTGAIVQPQIYLGPSVAGRQSWRQITDF